MKDSLSTGGEQLKSQEVLGSFWDTSYTQEYILRNSHAIGNSLPCFTSSSPFLWLLWCLTFAYTTPHKASFYSRFCTRKNGYVKPSGTINVPHLWPWKNSYKLAWIRLLDSPKKWGPGPRCRDFWRKLEDQRPFLLKHRFFWRETYKIFPLLILLEGVVDPF